MVSKKQRRRQLAREHWRRQQARRMARRRRARNRTMVVGSVVAVLVVLGGGVWFANAVGGGSSDNPSAAPASPKAGHSARPSTAASSTPSGPVHATCAYRPNGDRLLPGVGRPPAKQTLAPGYVATISTTRGPVTARLFSAKAPCAVGSFVYLARQGAFDDTACTRVTGPQSGGEFLECGDPTGTGLGTVGFDVPLENAGTDPYAKGLLVMAPGTHGGDNRFRILYGQSLLGDRLTVFGRVTSGLSVVSDVAKGGVATTNGQAPAEGMPATPISVTSIDVTAAR